MLTGLPGLSAQQAPQVPFSQASSPELTSGTLQPLTERNVARPMRYQPRNGGFAIHNGSEFFNRPLYAPGVAFRVDGGDRPEFSLYLPGHGGNLRLALRRADGSAKWLFELASVETLYVDGRLEYRLRDEWLGAAGSLTVQALVTRDSLLVRVEGEQTPAGLEIAFAFGGVSGRKGKRGGDIGCESEPVAQFFQLRPGECDGNRWSLWSNGRRADLAAKAANLVVETPMPASLALGDASLWNGGWAELWKARPEAPPLPVLLGYWPLETGPQYLSIFVAPKPVRDTLVPAPADAFAERLHQLQGATSQLRMTSPDPHFDAITSALCIAKDALWDEAQGCVMHGAVAWRQALAGWRGPYAFDALGDHTRMRTHLRHWIARQNREPIRNGASGRPDPQGFIGIEEAKGAPDPRSLNARSEGLLHSNGDLSHNHYDMNLVFFDALLRHLRWTGDHAFAEEAWAALEAHAAWERRSFRRDYAASESGETLPLYEAYAAIWASDNLQYNGGGATHSSAYNVFLNERLAEIAVLLGKPAEVAAAYRAEANAIRRAMQQLLWMQERGAYAESRDWMQPRVLLESPALWTVYQALDSGVPTEQQGWQIVTERLQALRPIPISGDGVPADAGWLLPSSDWLPYIWSLTLINLGENLGLALAMFQAGMADEGYALLRGSLLDAGFRGLCPGNFPMSVALDPHRQESQRDFGDPIGCAARAIVEGLWGIAPDLLHGRVRLRPQLPLGWTAAKLEHRELTIEYSQRNGEDHWRIEHRFPAATEVMLELRGRTIRLPEVRVGGAAVQASFVEDAVGEPRLRIRLTGQTRFEVAVRWRGEMPARNSRLRAENSFGRLHAEWPREVDGATVQDPQGWLESRDAVRPKRFTVFARQRGAESRHWVPVAIDVSFPPPKVTARQPFRADPIDLTPHLNAHARDILSRGYEAPRSGLTSLNLPTGLLGGWADFDEKAVIDDAGLRRAGGRIVVDNDLSFALPIDPQAPNCRFLSHWAQDQPELIVPVAGPAQALHLLLACTTFPQACWTPHAKIRLDFADGSQRVETLRSPTDVWPVEQDYMIDEFIFRIDKGDGRAPGAVTRVDLATGRVRTLDPRRPTAGGRIPGGSAFVVSLPFYGERAALRRITLRCELYGVVLGLLAMTLERPIAP